MCSIEEFCPFVEIHGKSLIVQQIIKTNTNHTGKHSTEKYCHIKKHNQKWMIGSVYMKYKESNHINFYDHGFE